MENVIYLFLNTYYQNDSNIQELSKAGVCKWMSLYMNNVFNDPLIAKEFTENFIQYLKDFDTIYKHLTNMSISFIIC